MIFKLCISALKVVVICPRLHRMWCWASVGTHMNWPAAAGSKGDEGGKGDEVR